MELNKVKVFIILFQLISVNALNFYAAPALLTAGKHIPLYAYYNERHFKFKGSIANAE